MDGQIPFVTFYSFKGGVGRSMALANAGWNLAHTGSRVLMLDLDLEAPGISYLPGKDGKEEHEETPGFVDLFYRHLEKPEGSALSAKPGDEWDRIAEFCRQIPVPQRKSRPKNTPEGSLTLMPAGKLDAGYEQRLKEIDLGTLYKRNIGLPLLKQLREHIQASEEFDYVLIDSRTGFSDEAMICLRDLGDRLILFSGLNEQNISGTARLLQLLQSWERKPIVSYVVSPVPLGEDELKKQRLDHMTRTFTESWGNAPKRITLIPYHPRLALDEKPYIHQFPESELAKAYSAIEEQVREYANESIVDLRKEFTQVLVDKKISDAEDLLHRIHYLDPEEFDQVILSSLPPYADQSDYLSLFQAGASLSNSPEILRWAGDASLRAAQHKNAINYYDDARTGFLNRRDQYSATFSLLQKAYTILENGDTQVARDLYQQGLDELVDSGGSASNIATARHEIARATLEMGDAQSARDLFRQALDEKVAAGSSASSIAITRCALSSAVLEIGDAKTARDLFQQAHDDMLATGDSSASLITLARQSVGLCLFRLKQVEEATAIYHETRSVIEAPKSSASARDVTISHLRGAEILSTEEPPTEALDCARQALSLSETCGFRAYKAKAQYWLARLGDEEGIKALPEAVAFFDEGGYKSREAEAARELLATSRS